MLHGHPTLPFSLYLLHLRGPQIIFTKNNFNPIVKKPPPIQGVKHDVQVVIQIFIFDLGDYSIILTSLQSQLQYQ